MDILRSARGSIEIALVAIAAVIALAGAGYYVYTQRQDAGVTATEQPAQEQVASEDKLDEGPIEEDPTGTASDDTTTGDDGSSL